MLLFLFSCVDSGSGQICRILALSLLLIRICFVRILNGGIGLSACHIYSSALRAYAYRHKIPTKREYGRTYYSKSHLDELRRTDLVNDERYYTVEQVQRIYGLSSANICHIVKVKHIEKVKVGVKNLLLRSDVERVMAERNRQP